MVFFEGFSSAETTGQEFFFNLECTETRTCRGTIAENRLESSGGTEIELFR